MLFLDSDIVVDVLRRFPAAMAWAKFKQDDFIIAGFTAMEALAGCRDSAAQAIADRVLSQVRIVWPSSSSCEAALADYGRLHLTSGIGYIDALIAHTAIELALPLNTFNVKHYRHIPALRTIQPYPR